MLDGSSGREEACSKTLLPKQNSSGESRHLKTVVSQLDTFQALSKLHLSDIDLGRVVLKNKKLSVSFPNDSVDSLSEADMHGACFGSTLPTPFQAPPHVFLCWSIDFLKPYSHHGNLRGSM